MFDRQNRGGRQGPVRASSHALAGESDEGPPTLHGPLPQAHSAPPGATSHGDT